MELIPIYTLVVAFLLDLWLGDPRKLPHLIVGYGHLISIGEKALNKTSFRFAKGMLLTIGLVTASYTLPYFILLQLQQQELPYITIPLSIILLFYCLANKTLIQEGKAVFQTLNEQGLEAGRKRLSWIVGRDTSNLTSQQIRIATLETMAENLSDGVIAPLFYFAILGVPGAMTYKMINTLDSMIGYKSDKYEQFGKFAAKLDDIANFIPARITAILMLIVTFKLNGLKFVFTEGKKHSSPNAGYPEAALAYILSCRFGGPNIYHGQLIDKPYIGSNDRMIEHEEINKASKVNFLSSLLFTTLCIILIALYKI